MIAVGVPLIAPVELSNERPDGSDGETDHDVTVPPLDVGVTVVIAVPLLNVNEFGVYVIEDGATSFTWIVMVVVPLPPGLVAVTV